MSEFQADLRHLPYRSGWPMSECPVCRKVDAGNANSVNVKEQ
jgi:hypothetical protein